MQNKFKISNLDPLRAQTRQLNLTVDELVRKTNEETGSLIKGSISHPHG